MMMTDKVHLNLFQNWEVEGVSMKERSMKKN